MDITALKNCIKANKIPKFLIFAGDEWKVQEIYIQQIAKVTGKEIKRIDSILDILGSLKNRSLMKNAYNYIVRDDKALMQDEKLQAQIESLLADNNLILILSNIDKRTRFYRTFKASIIEFERLSNAMLIKYTQREIKLSMTNIQRLLDVCEYDFGKILLEIDKIKNYVKYVETHD